MTPETILKRLANLKTWKQGTRRAPHKPLLVLLALARARRRENRLQTYASIAPTLTDLLTRFGPPKKGQQEPIHPFVRLMNDGLWEIPGEARLPRTADGKRKATKSITASELQDLQDLEAGFPEDIYNAFRNDRDVARRAVELLLENEFPQSYHRELLQALGLDDLGAPGPAEHAGPTRKREPRFRDRVITAYEHRCAVCHYGIRIDNQLLGLEAAHILWHSKGGPDRVSNGLALCMLHHHALDRGGISVSDKLTLLVSPHLHGDAAKTWFLNYEGKELRPPRDSGDRPDAGYLAWHRREVFRGTPD